MKPINYLQEASQKNANFIVGIIDQELLKLVNQGLEIYLITHRIDNLKHEFFYKDKLVKTIEFHSGIEREGEKLNFVTRATVKDSA
jgi:hypothetical protein